MNYFPIVYKIGETMVDGVSKSIFIDDEVEDVIQMVLRNIWNSRPDYDPPTWGELFNYTRSQQDDLCPNLICEATMEQVICFILGKSFCQVSIDEITPMAIEPNIEDIVKEAFEQLECDDSFMNIPLN